jgi:hypothetical protein
VRRLRSGVPSPAAVVVPASRTVFIGTNAHTERPPTDRGKGGGRGALRAISSWGATSFPWGVGRTVFCACLRRAERDGARPIAGSREHGARQTRNGGRIFPPRRKPRGRRPNWRKPQTGPGRAQCPDGLLVSLKGSFRCLARRDVRGTTRAVSTWGVYSYRPTPGVTPGPVVSER